MSRFIRVHSVLLALEISTSSKYLGAGRNSCRVIGVVWSDETLPGGATRYQPSNYILGGRCWTLLALGSFALWHPRRSISLSNSLGENHRFAGEHSEYGGGEL